MPSERRQQRHHEDTTNSGYNRNHNGNRSETKNTRKDEDKRFSREHVGLSGSLWNASMPENQDVAMDPSPTQDDTSATSGEPSGIAGLEYEDLLADSMDEALESSDLSLEEAYEVFHDILPKADQDTAKKGQSPKRK